MEDKIEKYLKKYTPNVVNLHPDKKKVFELFVRFIVKHNIDDGDATALFKAYDKHGPLRTISDGIVWRTTNKGYDYFYFLNLRWLTYLSECHILYANAYNNAEAYTKLLDCVGFSSRKKKAIHYYDRKFNLRRVHFKNRCIRRIKEIGPSIGIDLSELDSYLEIDEYENIACY